MTQAFLKTKEVPIAGIPVTITQLSGLERLDFMEYCSSISEPERPIKPDDGASEIEQDNYLIELNKYTQQWFRINFIVQARLVAYGYREGEIDIDARQEQIMSMMTPEQVASLHNEIASFSGLPVPAQEETAPSDGSETTTTTETATTKENTTQEPTDPKV